MNILDNNRFSPSENVIVITGSTASGKTGISIELAKEIGGEIISADSMQVYKSMDIGTAKPDINERRGVRHYLIDEVYPDEDFNVVKFQEKALTYIEKILSEGKIPIIAGGTGLYINSLLYNIRFTETISDVGFRESLYREAEIRGNEYLYNWLKEIDPEAAAKTHPNNLKRVIRALEVYEFSKRTISEHNRESMTIPPKYNYIVIGLTLDRELLYERINKRVDEMVERGLVNEVRELVKLGCNKTSTAMQGLGYKEIIGFLDGVYSLETAIEEIKKDTRHFAKRQMTWFKRLENIHWIDVGVLNSKSGIIKNIKEYIATFGIIL